MRSEMSWGQLSSCRVGRRKKNCFDTCKKKRNKWLMVGDGGVRWLEVGSVVAKRVGPSCRRR
jgi:hypothetical protein